MLFFHDESSLQSIDYEKFYSDLKSKDSVTKFIYYKDTYSIILELAAALFYGKDVILLDSDFSQTELTNLGVSNEDLLIKYNIKDRLNTVDSSVFVDRVLSNVDFVKIGIFTSGTTGKPKCFHHLLRSLMRNTKINEKHANDIWALAYNVTHFAGIQVILQALLNHNTIIDLFGKNSANADVLLDNYGCNCISATPTYFRNYLFSTNKVNRKIKSVTFGGEKFSDQLLIESKRKFPLARVRNIYASTEVGSILSGNGETFTIPINLKDKIKVSTDKHLVIHSSLLNGKHIDGDWYDTKDVVETNEDGTFRFLSRNTDFINVGGYKVNLLEVEEEILKVDGVIDVSVYGRDNSVIGKILVADIVLSDEYDPKEVKKAITAHIKNNLQPFKMPRLINVVSELKKNRTGKKVR